MRTVDLILYILAAVCFALAAFSVSAHPRVNLIALGLLASILVPLIALARA